MVYKVNKNWIADFRGTAFLFATKAEAVEAVKMLQEAVKKAKTEEV